MQKAGQTGPQRAQLLPLKDGNKTAATLRYPCFSFSLYPWQVWKLLMNYFQFPSKTRRLTNGRIARFAVPVGQHLLPLHEPLRSSRRRRWSVGRAILTFESTSGAGTIPRGPSQRPGRKTLIDDCLVKHKHWASPGCRLFIGRRFFRSLSPGNQRLQAASQCEFYAS